MGPETGETELGGSRLRAVIDPEARWRESGGKPDYAGLPCFGGAVYSEDPAELDGFDVAIVGAPIDELVSERSGARLGPWAIRAAGTAGGPHLETGAEPLRVIDYGDAPVIPGDPARSHAAIEQTVGEVLEAGLLPAILGGDHSISEPDLRACSAHHGRLGLVHLDAHTDTAERLFGAGRSHGTWAHRAIADGLVDPERYVQIGLRGYWPETAALRAQEERGITAFPMHELRSRGIAAVVAATLDRVGPGPAFLSVDVDVLDPSVAPGTGTPEPGGMGAAELLGGVRELARGVELVGVDVVEVLPTLIGSADPTALVADRIVREALIGVALRRGE